MPKPLWPVRTASSSATQIVDVTQLHSQTSTHQWKMCRLYCQPQDTRQPMAGTTYRCSMKHCTSKRCNTSWSIRINSDIFGQRYKTTHMMPTNQWLLAAQTHNSLHASNRKLQLSFLTHGTLPRKIWMYIHTSRWRHVTYGILTNIKPCKLNMVCKSN